MEDITDVDCRNAKKALKYFNNKNLGGYHDFLQMYLRILETNVLKYMILILLIFYQHLD